MQTLRVCESQSIKLILIIHAINEGCYGPIVIFIAGKQSCTTAVTIISNDAIQSVAGITAQCMFPKRKSVLAVPRGTQREYSSKPLEHSIVKRILVFKP